MHFHPAYPISVLGAASATLCFAAALALTPAGVGPRPDSSREPGISGTVNRALKGDRLRVIVRPPDAAPFEVREPTGARPKSMDGCESVFGPMDESPRARLAQRCVT
jgi:hypothetical protein